MSFANAAYLARTLQDLKDIRQKLLDKKCTVKVDLKM